MTGALDGIIGHSDAMRALTARSCLPTLTSRQPRTFMFTEDERQKQRKRLSCWRVSSYGCFPRSRLSRSKNLFQRWFSEKEKGRKRFSDLTSDPILVSGCGGRI